MIGDDAFYELADGTIVDARTRRVAVTTINGVALRIFTEALLEGFLTSPIDTLKFGIALGKCAYDIAQISSMKEALTAGEITAEEYQNFIKNTATFQSATELVEGIDALIEYHNRLKANNDEAGLKLLYASIAGTILSPDPNIGGKLAGIIADLSRFSKKANQVADAAQTGGKVADKVEDVADAGKDAEKTNDALPGGHQVSQHLTTTDIAKKLTQNPDSEVVILASITQQIFLITVLPWRWMQLIFTPKTGTNMSKYMAIKLCRMPTKYF